MSASSKTHNPFETGFSRLQADLTVNQPGTQIIPLSAVEREFSRILRIQLRSPFSGAGGGHRTGRVAPAPPHDGVGNQYLLMKQYILPQDVPRQVMEERLQKDYATMERLYTRWKHSSKFAIPRPIACYADLLTLVMEECSGEDLAAILKREAPFFPSPKKVERLEYFFYLCGEWLKANQNSAPVKQHLSVYSLETYLDYNDIRLRRLVQYETVPLDESFRKKILQSMQRRWADIDVSETYAVEIHGDYGPGNVMIEGEKLIIIDIAGCGQGSIYHDLSRFYHQLDLYLLKPAFRPKVIRRLQRVLLDGYDSKLEVQHPLFEMMLVQHTLCHLMGVGLLEQLPIHERWYNRRIIRRHIRWLRKWVAEG